MMPETITALTDQVLPNTTEALLMFWTSSKMNAATFKQPETNLYRQPVDEALAVLATDAQLGLSEEEARARLEKYGKNEVTA